MAKDSSKRRHFKIKQKHKRKKKLKTLRLLYLEAKTPKEKEEIFEKARKIAGERGVCRKGIRSVAKQVATDLIAKEEYSAAIALAEEFRIRAAAEEAVLAMFEYCMESGSYLEAAHLAKAYGMEKMLKSMSTD